MGIIHWHTEHIQRCLACIGIKGTKHSSNHWRDFADCTDTVKTGQLQGQAHKRVDVHRPL